MYVCACIYTSTADMEPVFSDTICSNILDVCTHALHLMCGKMAEHRERESKSEHERSRTEVPPSVRMRDVHCSGRGTKGALGLCVLWHERILYLLIIIM